MNWKFWTWPRQIRELTAQLAATQAKLAETAAENSSLKQIVIDHKNHIAKIRGVHRARL